MIPLPAEAQVFFLALKPRGERNDAALAAMTAQPIDWKLVTQIAEHEKLLSILWYGLNGRVDTMPPALVAAARRRTAVIEFQMAATRVRLEQVVTRLAADGIPSLLLKGAALAHSVYPSFAHRPMSDLDLLVPPDLAGQAWQNMRDLGWRLEQQDGAEFHAEFHHLKPLIDPSGSGIVLEIHRSMMPSPGPFSLAESDVWRDATKVRVGGSSAYVPADLHGLLHLCVHFGWSHSLVQGVGRTVRDVATLTRSGTIDWDAFIPLARQARAATCAYWTLAMSRTLADAPVPDAVLEALRPHQSRALSRALERSYIVFGVMGSCPSVLVAEALWSAGTHPRRSGHGAHRPWKVTERFKEVFQQAPKPSVMTRVRAHARDIGTWVRFARIILGTTTART